MYLWNIYVALLRWGDVCKSGNMEYVWKYVCKKQNTAQKKKEYIKKS